MGITGLIPFLEKASSKINVKDLKGSAVAIDTYCWLHKGAIACADKISRGEDTDIHIKFCLKYVNLLLSHNVKPILIFDGQHLPAKALTEKRRRETRSNSKKKAAELLRMGKIEEARSHMRRCIDITHEMALKLIKECRKINVDCIVAPYEADAQIAYLNKCNIVQYVITEDSDLTLFGCNKVIFKFDLAGNGLLVESNKYHLAMGCRLEKFSIDKFRYMCILSGCDYLDSLPGIGLAKACKFILMTEETDMQRALVKIPSYLNMRHLIITEEYIEGFLKADATFKHMFVYDPLKRKMVRLNELSEFNTDIQYCSNAGQPLDDETAFQLALGNINPFNHKKLDDWNPDEYFSSQVKHNNLRYLKSIWLRDFKIHTPKKKHGENHCALEFKKIHYSLSNTNCTETKDEKQSESEILSLYTSREDETNKKRRRSNSSASDSDSSLENTPGNRQKQKLQSPPIETPIKNNHNPFVKHKSPSITSSCSSQLLQDCANNSSLLKNISPSKRKIDHLLNKSNDHDQRSTIKVKEIVKSRLFASNLLLLQEEQKNNQKNIDDNENNRNSIEEKIIEEENSIQNIQTINEIKELSEKHIPTSSLYLSSPEILEKIKIHQQNESPSSSKQNNESSAIDNAKLKDLIEEEKVEDLKSDSKNTKYRKIGLSKPSAKQQKFDITSKGQSRLSMFGFEKRSKITRKS